MRVPPRRLRLVPTPRSSGHAISPDWVRVLMSHARVMLQEVRRDGSIGEEWHIPADEFTEARLHGFEQFIAEKRGTVATPLTVIRGGLQ